MSEPPIPGLEVPQSAEEARVRQNGTQPIGDTIPPSQSRTEPPRAASLPVFQCHTCADRGTVELLLGSADGPKRKEIACPDCKNGKLRMEGADTRIESLERAIRVLKMAAIAAIVLAAVAFIMGGPEPGIPWKKATEGVSE